MTVSELKAALEQLEQLGKGDIPVVVSGADSRTLIEVMRWGTVECWPDASRLTRGEYRSAGQRPDRSGPSIEAAILV